MTVQKMMEMLEEYGIRSREDFERERRKIVLDVGIFLFPLSEGEANGENSN